MKKSHLKVGFFHVVVSCYCRRRAREVRKYSFLLSSRGGQKRSNLCAVPSHAGQAENEF